MHVHDACTQVEKYLSCLGLLDYKHQLHMFLGTKVSVLLRREVVGPQGEVGGEWQ